MKKYKSIWNKDFLLLWQGTAFSSLGAVLYSVAIGFWVYEKTGSTAIMGIISSISLFVTMLLSPLSGAICDRSNRKKIIVSMDLLRGVVMIIVGFISLNNQLSVPIVIITALVCSLGGVLFSPAANTTFVDVVPKEELPRAQSISNGSSSLLETCARGISGTLVLVIGVSWLVLITGFCYLASALSEIFIDVPLGEKQGTAINFKVIVNDLISGAKTVFQATNLRLIILSALVLNFLGAGIGSLYLPFMVEKGFGVVEYGYLAAAYSIGAFVGIGVVALFKMNDDARYRFCLLGFFISAILSACGYYANNFYLITGFLFLSAIFNSIANMIFNAVFVLAIPREKRGLVLGFIVTGSTGGSALSVLAYGFLGEFFPLWIIGVIGCLISLFAMIPMATSKEVKSTFYLKEE